MHVMHIWLAATCGAVIGFTACALLASGKQQRVITCLECKHARYEEHGGTRELVCWRAPATGGRVVRPSGWCVDAEWRDECTSSNA